MSLVKNSIYNIVGFAIPTLIAIPAMGVLARQLGIENFGLFTLAFAIVGYASIFDGGITRAVIREISIFREDEIEQKKIISTASLLIIFLGLLASVILWGSASHLVNLLQISSENTQQAKYSFELLAFIIPIYLINQIWLAYLEGQEQFVNINIQRIISGILIAIFPAIFCLYSPSLVAAILGLVVGRYFSLLLTLILCWKMIISSGLKFNKIVFRRLISFGSWLTISNLISPIMVYFDRFVISYVMGANKIAFYTAPAEAVSRLNNIPFALSRALFPKLTNSANILEKKKLVKISYFIVGVVCLPIVILGYAYADLILKIWFGADYAISATGILRVLLIGFYFNALAQIPYSLLQANGDSKTTALIHLFEIVPYILILLFLTSIYGILGAAITWTIRVILDLIILFLFSKKVYS